MLTKGLSVTGSLLPPSSVRRGMSRFHGPALLILRFYSSASRRPPIVVAVIVAAVVVAVMVAVVATVVAVPVVAAVVVVPAAVVVVPVVVPLLLPRIVCRSQRLDSSTRTLLLTSR